MIICVYVYVSLWKLIYYFLHIFDTPLGNDTNSWQLKNNKKEQQKQKTKTRQENQKAKTCHSSGGINRNLFSIIKSQHVTLTPIDFF